MFLAARYLTTAEYFKIKDSPYFAGQNIFKVNLQKETQRLSKQYPDYKRIGLRRLMPNDVMVDFQLRQAVAKVKLSNKYFYVDEEGVLFHPVGQEYDNLQLPLIIGLDTRIFLPRSGVKYNEHSLLTTLEFINNLNKDSELSREVKIKEINLKNINDVFLFTTTDCKVNLGIIDSLNKRLSILQRLVSEIDTDLSKIEYIDLRFREPVVKYR